MSDMPEVKFRDMGAKLTALASTHQQIRQGIAERAETRASYLAERDRQLNADQRVTRGK